MATTYIAQHPHEIVENEQEAVNRVLTGEAIIAYSNNDIVVVFPAPLPVTPPVIPPPDGEPTETAIVQWPVAVEDTDIALTTAPTTVVVGSIFLIDTEYMTVTDTSNADNPGVTRATRGSTIAPHDAGAEVTIWGTPPATQARHTKAGAANKRVLPARDETKREEAKRERKEEQREEDAEDRADAKRRNS